MFTENIQSRDGGGCQYVEKMNLHLTLPFTTAACNSEGMCMTMLSLSLLLAIQVCRLTKYTSSSTGKFKVQIA